MAQINSFRDLIVYPVKYRSEFLRHLLFKELMKGYDEVRKMLISMMNNPEKFCK